jgi:hypothetical protein
MTTITSPAAALGWPPEVTEFATGQGVEHCLPGVVAMTRQLFPTARRLQVFLEPDWDIAQQSYIVIQVEVTDWSVAQATAARQQWMQELGQCCALVRPGPFVLALELST